MLCPHPEEPRSGVSKDGNTVLFSILRDAAKRPLLRMRSSCSLRAKNLDQVICLSRPVPFVKIFLFPFGANHFSIRGHPGPHRGAFRDRHERRVGMRWTRAAPKTRAQSCGRRSRVVLTPQWLVSSWRYASHHAGDGDNKARSPGRARSKPLKPSRAGMPGDPGELVVTNACAFYTSRTRLRGQRAPGIPRSLLRVAPAPFSG